VSGYDPSGPDLFPDSYIEEPTRPCDSGEVDRSEQARADALFSEMLRQRWSAWERRMSGHSRSCHKWAGGKCSCGAELKVKREEGR
jgi:hypothetical protein